MAGDMFDAVAWRNLLGKQGYKVGYADGPVSAWPAEAFTALEAVIPWRITVTADARWEIFDHEAGNASATRIATAVAGRLKAGQWSVCYTNAAELPALAAALARRNLAWTPAEAWPAPGVYLWCAAPGTPPGQHPPWAPIAPVAVQHTWEKDYDLSATFGPFPVLPARPAPAPPPVPPTPGPAPGPPPGWCVVNLPVLRQGSRGPAVAALQRLLGGLTVDQDFGPNTHNRVVAHQRQAGLAPDGIVGTHTWGHLLGAPQ
jgi:hypothetical protein